MTLAALRQAAWLALGVACAPTVPACTLATPYPAAGAEMCDDGRDDDLDGRIDCSDPDCNGVAPCVPQLSWSEGVGPAVAPPDAACPAGWRAVPGVDGAPPTCDPYPEGGPQTCPSGSMHFPGDPGCAPIGRACGADEWSTELPSSGVVFVRPGASGTGSRTQPFGDLVAAVASAARSGAIVALSRGVHHVPAGWQLTSSVTLRGACAAQTSIVVDGAGNLAVLGAAGATVRVEDLTLDGLGVTDGIVVQGPLQMRGVRLTGTQRFGILIRGTSEPVFLDASELVVDHVSGSPGAGIFSDDASTLRLARGVISDVHQVGLITRPGCATSLIDVVVRDVTPDPIDPMGFAIGAQVEGTTEIQRGVFERLRAPAIVLAGASADVEDVVVRHVAGRPGAGSPALYSQTGHATVRRAWIEDVYGVGLGAAVGAVLEGADLVLRGVHVDEVGLARGVLAQSATLRLTRAFVADGERAGVHAAHASTLELTDVTIASSQLGIVVDHGSAARLQRVRVSDSVGAGVLVDGRGATLVAEQLFVDGVAPTSDGPGGYGVSVQDGAYAVIDHAALRGAVFGALAIGTSTLLVTDAVTLPPSSASCGAGCGGVAAFEGARVALSRVRLDGELACAMRRDADSRLDVRSGEVRGASAGLCFSASEGESPPDGDGFRYGGAGAAIASPSGPAPARAVAPPDRPI